MKANAEGHLPSALTPLTALPHWVIWRWETTKKGKRTKVPYQAAHPGKKASSTNPKTWSDYATVVNASKKADGIGFCLFEFEYGAFDLDDCRNAETGVIDTWAHELIARAGSYTEVTISGSGLRVIGRATGPKIHRKQPVVNGATLETYRRAERYIVVTGDVLPGCTPVLADLDAVMDEVVAELGDAPKEKSKEKVAPRERKALPQSLANRLHVEGPGAYNSRSEALFAFINLALRGGVDENDIIASLLDETYSGKGIYEHCIENGGKDYIKKQIEHASNDLSKVLKWRERTKKGKPVASLYNARLAITTRGIVCRYDLFHDKILIGYQGDEIQHEVRDLVGEVTDNALTRLRQMVSEHFGFDPTARIFTTQ